MQPWPYRDGDVALRGELFPPTAPANGCAILVAHEADGIGGNVRRHAARLAAEGYLVGAADLHGAGRPLTGDEIPPMLDGYRRDPARLARRVRAGLDALAAEAELPPARLAAIGYCFGGWAVLELARSGAGPAAVASFHGLLAAPVPAGRHAIRPAVLACTGALDPLVPPADVAAFQAEMTAAGADWQLLVHGTARHSYTNEGVDALGDPRMAYDKAAADLSWTVLLAHLDRAFARA
jgi:dienelactone hydrolase